MREEQRILANPPFGNSSRASIENKYRKGAREQACRTNLETVKRGPKSPPRNTVLDAFLYKIEIVFTHL